MFFNPEDPVVFPVLQSVSVWLGGSDGLLYALIGFVIADYVSGVLAALSEGQLNSKVGFKGIAKKVLIFVFIALAHLIDTHLVGVPGVIRAATILFYISNEGVSLLENATRLGLPVPDSIRGALDVVARKSKDQAPVPDSPHDPTPGV